MFVIGTGGPLYAPRYYIQDGESRFWSERLGDWTNNPREAALYSNQGEVGQKLHELFLIQIPGEVQTFCVPCPSRQPLRLHELGLAVAQRLEGRPKLAFVGVAAPVIAALDCRAVVLRKPIVGGPLPALGQFVFVL